MSEVKYAMVSQPMAGLSDDEIADVRDDAIAAMDAAGYSFISTLFSEDDYEDFVDAAGEDVENVKRPALMYMSRAIEAMAFCDAVFFCDGWSDARGCRIEHECAKAYGLTCVYQTPLGWMECEQDGD